MKHVCLTTIYVHLANNAKQIHALIGLRLYFYNSIETQNSKKL